MVTGILFIAVIIIAFVALGFITGFLWGLLKTIVRWFRG